MSSVTITEAPSRMKSEDRRELVLDAAMGVFGDYGYVGATTDQVAKAAGVSQPYVVRMFGTKEKLFLEVLHRALAAMMVAFRAALDGDPEIDLERRLGLSYFELLRKHGLLLSLMHSFVLGSDPVIGAAARLGFLEIYSLLRDEAGFTPLQAHQFLADGMLANTMISTRMGDLADEDPRVREMLEACFPEKLALVLELGRLHRPAAR
jgi:TetR/AcrR family transcriptional regulator